MTTTNISSLQQLVLTNAVTPPKPTGNGGFFEALAQAWGAALDKQAQVLSDQSQAVNAEGGDTPGAITELSAESARMAFLANSAHTSQSEASEALKALAQK